MTRAEAVANLEAAEAELHNAYSLVEFARDEARIAENARNKAQAALDALVESEGDE